MSQEYWVEQTVGSEVVLVGRFHVADVRRAGACLARLRKGAPGIKSAVRLVGTNEIDRQNVADEAAFAEADDWTSNDEADVSGTEHRE